MENQSARVDFFQHQSLILRKSGKGKGEYQFVGVVLTILLLTPCPVADGKFGKKILLRSRQDSCWLAAAGLPPRGARVLVLACFCIPRCVPASLLVCHFKKKKPIGVSDQTGKDRGR